MECIMFTTLTLFILSVSVPIVLYEKPVNQYYWPKEVRTYDYKSDKMITAKYITPWREIVHFRKEMVYRIEETNEILVKNGKKYELCKLGMSTETSRVNTYYYLGSCKALIKKLNK